MFTASGSEADSLAILGSAARFHGGSARAALCGGEHPAVLRYARAVGASMGHTVEAFGAARRDGVADLDDGWHAMLDEHVGRCSSCMQVNNETGDCAAG